VEREAGAPMRLPGGGACASPKLQGAAAPRFTPGCPGAGLRSVPCIASQPACDKRSNPNPTLSIPTLPMALTQSPGFNLKLKDRIPGRAVLRSLDGLLVLLRLLLLLLAQVQTDICCFRAGLLFRATSVLGPRCRARCWRDSPHPLWARCCCCCFCCCSRGNTGSEPAHPNHPLQGPFTGGTAQPWPPQGQLLLLLLQEQHNTGSEPVCRIHPPQGLSLEGLRQLLAAHTATHTHQQPTPSYSHTHTAFPPTHRRVRHWMACASSWLHTRLHTHTHIHMCYPHAAIHTHSFPTHPPQGLSLEDLRQLLAAHTATHTHKHTNTHTYTHTYTHALSTRSYPHTQLSHPPSAGPVTGGPAPAPGCTHRRGGGRPALCGRGHAGWLPQRRRGRARRAPHVCHRQLWSGGAERERCCGLCGERLGGRGGQHVYGKEGRGRPFEQRQALWARTGGEGKGRASALLEACAHA